MGTPQGASQKELFIFKIDPALNIPNGKGENDACQAILVRLKKAQAKVETMDCRFIMRSSLEKGKKTVAQAMLGKLEVTGQDRFEVILAKEPEVIINGRQTHDKKWKETYADMQKKGNVLEFSPLSPVSCIPYQDLGRFYTWTMYKRIEDKTCLLGVLTNYSVNLPVIVDMTIDEKRKIPLAIGCYVFNGKYISALADVTYDKDGLPAKQTLRRHLPDGSIETSTLELTDVKINPRPGNKLRMFF